jgi:hypothetical protein
VVLFHVLPFFTEKPVFTIGTPAISDTDNFSEVSLDPSTDVTTTPTEPAGFYSPLSELDSMGNLQLPPTSNEQVQAHIDENLNPISAALAQLPTAASTVFSTFSNIIKGTQEQAVVEQQVKPPAMAYGFGYSENPTVDAPPPMFFSPTDDRLFNKTPEPVNNNAFRLGGNKKKTYAHIPGLSSNQQQQVMNSPPSVVMPPMPAQPEVSHDTQNFFGGYNQQPVMSVVEDQQQNQASYGQKSQEKSKFSLSSLLPSQLLEKIPSTKNLFGLSEASSFDQPQNYNDGFSVASNGSQASNLFAPQPEIQAAAPVIFFNSQQFVTSPFAQPIAAEPQQNHTEVFSAPQPETTPFLVNAFATSSFPPQSQFTPQEPSVVQAPPMTTAFNQPPMVEQQVNQPLTFETQANQPPPTFFNPTEASGLFKSGQAVDNKPKNPYSSARVRGVGMYKTRAQNETPVTQNFAMPPMPGFPPLPDQQGLANQHGYAMMPTAPSPSITPVDSRPPSMPPVSSVPPAEVHSVPSNFFSPIPPNIPPSVDSQMPDFPPPMPAIFTPSVPVAEEVKASSRPASIPPAVNQESFFGPPPTSFDHFASAKSFAPPPSIKKSDLNVPVSSPMNFFQSPPDVQPMVVPSQDAPVVEARSAHEPSPINFFNSQPSLVASDNKESTTSNFFAEESTTEVTQGLQENQETVCDAGDKIDQLSENIGSSLSLFATSELDASVARKPSAPLESLIPKYLDAQETAAPQPSSKTYRPVYRHWFYQSLSWRPFAMSDSLALDEALTSDKQIVATDGGRFEVNLKEKRRSSVYWSSGSSAIRRCSWFFRNPNSSDNSFIPFDEATAEFMESEYEKAMLGNSWNHRIPIPDTDDFIIIKDATSFEYHRMGQASFVKRGVDEFVIEDGEEAAVDHLVITVSNFGDKTDSNCELIERFLGVLLTFVVQTADELRTKCVEIVQNYYSEAFDCGQIGRLEVLPISLNSVDVLKMKEVSQAVGGCGVEQQDIIMKTAFYCNHEFYQVSVDGLPCLACQLIPDLPTENHEPPRLQPQRNHHEIPLPKPSLRRWNLPHRHLLRFPLPLRPSPSSKVIARILEAQLHHHKLLRFRHAIQPSLHENHPFKLRRQLLPELHERRSSNGSAGTTSRATNQTRALSSPHRVYRERGSRKNRLHRRRHKRIRRPKLLQLRSSRAEDSQRHLQQKARVERVLKESNLLLSLSEGVTIKYKRFYDC